MWDAERVFKALGDPTRREIVKLLRRGSKTSGEIAEHFPSAWATVSRHLSVLRDADVITAERDGNSIVYTLNATVIQELIEHLYDWTNKGGKRA
jgi:DNA-binding transcriptional ArsR family regulator